MPLHARTKRIEIAPMPAELGPATIPPEWVIEGRPETRVSALNHSEDTFASTFVWSCTAGTFHWHFISDETVHILEGEVLVSDDSGMQHRLTPGATALFRAGSHSVWHVPHFVKKIAFIYAAPSRVVSLPLRALRKVRRLMTGRSDQGISA